MTFEQTWELAKLDVHMSNPRARGHYVSPDRVSTGEFKRGHFASEKYRNQMMGDDSEKKVREPKKTILHSETYLSGGSKPRLEADGSYAGVNLSAMDFTDPSKFDEDVESFARTGAHETVHQLINDEIEEWADEEADVKGERVPYEMADWAEDFARGSNRDTLRSIGHEFGAFSSTPDSSQPSGFMSAEDRKKHMSNRIYSGSQYSRGNKPFSELRPKSEDVFDEAWGVVKMPIVPGSVYRDYRRERERDERMESLFGIDQALALAPRSKLYSAKFDDPETGEQLDMRGSYHAPTEGDMLSVSIKEPDSLPGENFDHLDERAYADFSPMGLRQDKPHHWYSVGTTTLDNFQRRGYATALYDLAAYLLDRQREGGAPLKESFEQSRAAKALWDSRFSDDLGDDEKIPENRVSWSPDAWDERRIWPVRGDLG